jgi:hypothetical protein
MIARLTTRRHIHFTLDQDSRAADASTIRWSIAPKIDRPSSSHFELLGIWGAEAVKEHIGSHRDTPILPQ